MRKLLALAPQSLSSTAPRRHEFALALRALRVGAPLVVLGLKGKGGSRLGNELEAFGVETTNQPKHYHRICTGTRPAASHGIDDAMIFDETSSSIRLTIEENPAISS